MAFIQISADFTKVIPLLTRIADALDRAYPAPLPVAKRTEKLTAADIYQVTPARRRQLAEDARQQAQGQPDPPGIPTD